MEFLDINLTRDSSLLLHAIHILFYWRIFFSEMEFSDINLTKDSIILLHAIHSPFYTGGF